MNFGSHFVKNVKKKKKLRIGLKWPKMRSKVNFGHPEWLPTVICKKNPKKLKFRIDLKCPEMRSKVNFGHPKWPTAAILYKKFQKNKVAYRFEMARNAIESEFRISKMGAGGHFVKNFKKFKFRPEVKWPEMRSKVNFGHPKWPTAAILSKISKKIKILYWSKMARNAIESEFRTSKMADGSHFVKISKKNSYVLI